MASFIARAILWLIFAFILFDTIKEFNKLFSLSLNPYYAIVPAILVYVFQEFMVKKWKENEKAVSANKPVGHKMDKIYYVFIWIFVVSLFIGILLVWAGVIFKGIIKGM